MTRSKTYHKLDAERFIRIWQSSKSRAEACKRYKHLSLKNTSQAAANLRQQGVKLRKFTHTGVRRDYAALGKLAQELAR